MTDALDAAEATHPRPERGPWDPVPSTPELAPGAVRRTTSIDMCRADGFDGTITADIRGRDLERRADGRDIVLDEVRILAEIEEWTGRLVTVEGSEHPGVGALLGTSIRRGYGRALVAALADDLAARTLLGSLLEDLGGALLVSGYAPLRRGLLEMAPGDGAGRAAAQQDICAGWAVGGPLVETLRHDDVTSVPLGPLAPPVTESGWHETTPPELETVTRIRSLDVGPASIGGGAFDARAHFRDSYAGDDGPMVMHEYLVHARIGGIARAIESVSVEPRVLPWRECPSAVGSAERVIGTPIADLPGLVRAELVGPPTCTHLNSTLRSLADVAALGRVVER